MSTTTTTEMPNARRQGSAHIDARPEGNLLKPTLRRLAHENPNATDDDLLALWCLAAEQDRELKAQIMDYAFTNHLKSIRGQFDNSDRAEMRDEQRATIANATPSEEPSPAAPSSTRIEQIQADMLRRTSRTMAHKSDPKTDYLFAMLINGKRIADCTAGEVREYVKTHRAVCTALLALAGNSPDSELIGEKRVLKFAKTEAAHAT